MIRKSDPFAQKIEKLQQPELTVLHRTSNHPRWWLMYCELERGFICAWSLFWNKKQYGYS